MASDEDYRAEQDGNPTGHRAQPVEVCEWNGCDQIPEILLSQLGDTGFFFPIDFCYSTLRGRISARIRNVSRFHTPSPILHHGKSAGRSERNNFPHTRICMTSCSSSFCQPVHMGLHFCVRAAGSHPLIGTLPIHSFLCIAASFPARQYARECMGRLGASHVSNLLCPLKGTHADYAQLRTPASHTYAGYMHWLPWAA